jgi:hypothetical protein
MKWYEALELAMKCGEKVRAKHWDVGVYIQLVHPSLGCSLFKKSTGGTFDLTPRSMRSDWEVFEDEPTAFQRELEKELEVHHQTGHWSYEHNGIGRGQKEQETQKPSQRINNFRRDPHVFAGTISLRAEMLHEIGQILDEHESKIERILMERTAKSTTGIR